MKNISRKKTQRFTATLTVMVILFASCKQKAGNEQTEKPLKDTAQSVVAAPLPSWNDGASKKAIMDYVEKVTKEGDGSFIPVADRIACFDNDGTLWSEQPLYFQFFFSFERIRQMAPQHPEWKNKEPFKSVLAGNIKAALASGEKGLLEIMGATFGGMSADAFDKSVKEWADTAVNPTNKKRFMDMTYLPMVELLQYLRANGFQTFIVSGGDISFMRVLAEKAYGIPPQQVMGSSFKVSYDSTGIKRLPQFEFMDDGPGKPVGIYQHIGKRPVFTAGNSDGDYAMLQYTTTATGYPRFGMIVHHTDSTREWAYDRGSPIGKLEKGLDDAAKYGWILVDMKNDWKVIYPFEK